ncbi:MAG: acetylglutamate kinase [Cyclobacteriaceae bacterium]
MKKLTILKIGGEVVDQPEKLKLLLQQWAAISGHKILIHGGGKQANELSKQLSIQPKIIDGRRITDAASLKVVTMIYAGLLNKQIVAQLQAYGCNAIGLTGADANMIPASRRSSKPIDFGFVGDIKPTKLNVNQLLQFLEKDLTPVFCAITHDGKGQLLNTNADTIASAIASSLSHHFNVHLILCLNQPGVLVDANDPQSLIQQLTPKLYQQMKEDGSVTDGMIPKLDTAFQALSNKVDQVIVGSPDLLKYYPEEIKGTMLCHS